MARCDRGKYEGLPRVPPIAGSTRGGPRVIVYCELRAPRRLRTDLRGVAAEAVTADVERDHRGRLGLVGGRRRPGALHLQRHLEQPARVPLLADRDVGDTGRLARRLVAE